ncbi:flagellar hook-length control protein FliK [Coralliovum pocilloporae]|uniref:flagellar hook-length control protein FliK n=1 Tax=Coralliovum pocilloporae TaxID=3066369 RepID=UPI0033071B3C
MSLLLAPGTGLPSSSPSTATVNPLAGADGTATSPSGNTQINKDQASTGQIGTGQIGADQANQDSISSFEAFLQAKRETGTGSSISGEQPSPRKKPAPGQAQLPLQPSPEIKTPDQAVAAQSTAGDTQDIALNSNTGQQSAKTPVYASPVLQLQAKTDTATNAATQSNTEVSGESAEAAYPGLTGLPPQLARHLERHLQNLPKDPATQTSLKDTSQPTLTTTEESVEQANPEAALLAETEQTGVTGTLKSDSEASDGAAAQQQPLNPAAQSEQARQPLDGARQAALVNAVKPATQGNGPNPAASDAGNADLGGDASLSDDGEGRATTADTAFKTALSRANSDTTSAKLATTTTQTVEQSLTSQGTNTQSAAPSALSALDSFLPGDQAAAEAQQAQTKLDAATASARVADTNRPAQLPETVANQLTTQIQRQILDGSSKFNIKLNPVELGRVDVTLRFDRDGNVMAHLFVERSETLDMMLRDSRALERSLAEAGVNVKQDGLSFSLSDGNDTASAFGDNTDQQGGNDGQASSDDTQSLTDQTAARAARPASSSLLDISI